MSTKALAIVSLWACVAFAPFGYLAAQQQKAWLPPRSGIPLRGLAKPAKPGKVAVRVKFGSEALAIIDAIAKGFAGSDRLDIAGDDFASLGRFCEFDDPFAVLVQEGLPTPRPGHLSPRRFHSARSESCS
jgi:hypothetical protein